MSISSIWISPFSIFHFSFVFRHYWALSLSLSVGFMLFFCGAARAWKGKRKKFIYFYFKKWIMRKTYVCCLSIKRRMRHHQQQQSSKDHLPSSTSLGFPTFSIFVTLSSFFTLFWVLIFSFIIQHPLVNLSAQIFIFIFFIWILVLQSKSTL